MRTGLPSNPVTQSPASSPSTACGPEGESTRVCSGIHANASFTPAKGSAVLTAEPTRPQPEKVTARSAAEINTGAFFFILRSVHTAMMQNVDPRICYLRTFSHRQQAVFQDAFYG